MPTKTDLAYRDYYKRIHGKICQFIIINLHHSHLDFAVISSEQIMNHFNLSRANDKRAEWILEDFKEYFEHIIHKQTPKGVGNYYLSNKIWPISIKDIQGPNAVIESLGKINFNGKLLKLPSERLIVKFLSGFSDGIYALGDFSVVCNESQQFSSIQVMDGLVKEKLCSLIKEKVLGLSRILNGKSLFNEKIGIIRYDKPLNGDRLIQLNKGLKFDELQIMNKENMEKIGELFSNYDVEIDKIQNAWNYIKLALK